ncbi:MAG TPA: hypothetical protein VIY48_06860 [Candidatus Paceibacterota bacterium]
MTGSFIRRKLTAIISIGGGQYGDTIEEIVTVENCRMSVDIRIYGAESMGEMDCKIYGLSLQLMNKLTTIGPIMNQIRFKNLIQIEASEGDEPPTTIYIGNIDTAFADMNQAPNVALNIKAFSGGALAIKPVDPVSYTTDVSVEQVMNDFAAKAGLTPQNHGVTGIMLHSPYFKDTLLNNIRKVAYDTDINFSIENNILTYWKKNGSLNDPEQLITPKRNMVGYPTFSSNCVIVRSLFLPYARLGTKIRIEDSELISVNKSWVAFQVSHELDSIIPDGRWFTTIGAGIT